MLDRVHKVAGRRSQKLPCEGLLPLRGGRLSSERLGGRTGSGLRSGHHCASGSVGQLLQSLRGLLSHTVKCCSQEFPCPGLLPFGGSKLSLERLGRCTGSRLRGGYHGAGGGVHQLLQPLRGQRLGPVKPCYRRPYQAVNHSLGAAQILQTVQVLRTANTLGTAQSRRAAHELGLVPGWLPHRDRLAGGQIRTSHGWGEGLGRA